MLVMEGLAMFPCGYTPIVDGLYHYLAVGCTLLPVSFLLLACARVMALLAAGCLLVFQLLALDSKAFICQVCWGTMHHDDHPKAFFESNLLADFLLFNCLKNQMQYWNKTMFASSWLHSPRISSSLDLNRTERLAVGDGGGLLAVAFLVHFERLCDLFISPMELDVQGYVVDTILNATENDWIAALLVCFPASIILLNWYLLFPLFLNVWNQTTETDKIDSLAGKSLTNIVSPSSHHHLELAVNATMMYFVCRLGWYRTLVYYCHKLVFVEACVTIIKNLHKELGVDLTSYVRVLQKELAFDVTMHHGGHHVIEDDWIIVLACGSSAPVYALHDKIILSV
ncbi:hypothetical protein E3N88_39158 [Mikania micrantha]|uniref:Uncharacterized protein n=1 Tax=Mikania micrantha TaxID=192012 RepID=A0A5N6LW82_9ASTR|nr:hypothetical protein E3N88_39158 [Mikania micrantha]